MNEESPLNGLTPAELDALRGAAAWYAKYRAADVAERADDRSAGALIEREEYLHLLSGLRKLGVRVRVPDALIEQVAAAA